MSLSSETYEYILNNRIRTHIIRAKAAVGFTLAVAFACLGGDYVVEVLQILEECLQDNPVKTSAKDCG